MDAITLMPRTALDGIDPLRNRTFVPELIISLDRINVGIYFILVRNRTSTNSTDELIKLSFVDKLHISFIDHSMIDQYMNHLIGSLVS